MGFLECPKYPGHSGTKAKGQVGKAKIGEIQFHTRILLSTLKGKSHIFEKERAKDMTSLMLCQP